MRISRALYLSLLCLPATLTAGSPGPSHPARISSAQLSDEQRIQAATTTANTNPLCMSIQPFYWEIGSSSAPLVGATAGGTSPTASTSMLIASASKWMFGAYLVQLRGGKLNAEDVTALTMRTGYTSFKYGSCVKYLPALKREETVDACFNTRNNATYTAAYDGVFYYNGGHFQKYADIDLGLGPDDSVALQQAIAGQVGKDFAFSYDSPQLAAGVKTTAGDYGSFLRRVLNGSLAIHDLLGAYATCTNPATCPTAAYSPVPSDESWHYSLAHWVEDDPAVGDGAFSSPGAFGFYPWIDASRTWYGILARYDGSGTTYNDSVYCGRLIRTAWVTGTPQQ